MATMRRTVEKPGLEDAPSNLEVIGCYVLDKSIWQLLLKTTLGVGDEIQLTDVVAMLMGEKSVEAFCTAGISHDCGHKFG